MAAAPPRTLDRALGIGTLVGIPVGLFFAFAVAPMDAYQGEVQRIMYLHVPVIWVAFLAFFVVCLASVLYLLRRRPTYDHLARASAELGVLFTGLTLASGSIWGKPTWGVWWTWDARLTTTAILFLIYVGYLMLRAFAEDQEAGARYAAVLGIIGFLDVPLIHLSVVWWRTLHQPATVLRPGGPSMDPVMLLVLLVNVAAFTLLYAYLVRRRILLERLRGEAAALRIGRPAYG